MKTLNARVPDPDYEAITDLARLNGMTIAALVAILVRWIVREARSGGVTLRSELHLLLEEAEKAPTDHPNGR